MKQEEHCQRETRHFLNPRCHSTMHRCQQHHRQVLQTDMFLEFGPLTPAAWPCCCEGVSGFPRPLGQAPFIPGTLDQSVSVAEHKGLKSSKRQRQRMREKTDATFSRLRFCVAQKAIHTDITVVLARILKSGFELGSKYLQLTINWKFSDYLAC